MEYRSAFNRFKSDKWAVGSFSFIIGIAFVAIFAYPLSPDKTMYGNQMHLSIHSQPPGFSCQVIVIPQQEIQDKDAGWWVELSQVNIDKALNEALKCDSSKLREKGDKAYNIIKNYTWHKQALKMKNNYIKIGKLKCTY